MNPVLAPRSQRCTICRSVAQVEDVTMRLYDAQLNHLPVTAAREYCQAVGLTGTVKAINQRIYAHRKHVDAWLERGALVIPGQVTEGVSRIPAAMGPASWLDHNQQAIDIGTTAGDILAHRLREGGMADKDVIAAFKVGQAAASRRADLELKGALKRAQSIARLAAGFAPPEPT